VIILSDNFWLGNNDKKAPWDKEVEENNLQEEAIPAEIPVIENPLAGKTLSDDPFAETPFIEDASSEPAIEVPDDEVAAATQQALDQIRSQQLSPSQQTAESDLAEIAAQQPSWPVQESTATAANLEEKSAAFDTYAPKIPIPDIPFSDTSFISPKPETAAEPWLQAKAEEQSASGLLSLAKDAQDQASNASVAASAAMQSAQKADKALKENPTSQTDMIYKAKLEATQQAYLAAEAALSAQLSAREAATGAVAQAEEAVEKSLISLKNYEKEAQRLQEMAQQTSEIAENALEAAAAANQQADLETEKNQAAQAAFLTANMLKEQAAKDYQRAQKELSTAKEFAQEANLKLAAIQQQKLRTKEESLLILKDISDTMVAASALKNMALTEEKSKDAQPPFVKPGETSPPGPSQAAAAHQDYSLGLNEQSPPETDLDPAAPEKTTKKVKKDRKKTSAAGIIIAIIAAVAIAFCLRAYVFEMTIVNGSSMVPTLQNGDRLFTSKISYIISEPQRGDIVVIDAPDREDEYYIKRIVGLPNDQITVKDGLVYINNELYTEPYLTNIYTNGAVDMIIDSDSYFVMGDNRNESHDSRDTSVGTIGSEHVVGKAVFRVYPFENFGSLYD
jgi:signal peptidase I